MDPQNMGKLAPAQPMAELPHTGPPSPSRSRSAPHPSVASTRIVQDHSQGAQDGRIPRLRMEDTGNSGRPATAPHGTVTPSSMTASPRAGGRQPPASRHGRHPQRLRTDPRNTGQPATAQPVAELQHTGPLSPNHSRSAQVPSTASTQGKQYRRAGARDGQIPHLQMEATGNVCSSAQDRSAGLRDNQSLSWAEDSLPITAWPT